MKITQETRRQLYFRVLERCNLPSHALNTLGSKYTVDLFPVAYTIVFPRYINPFVLERVIRKNQKKG
jgi:hypothetical protein